MTKSTITRERLEQLADNNTICKVSWDERLELARIALAAMDSEAKEPISFDEWSRKCALQITLCYPDFREKAQYIWDSARETQHVAPVAMPECFSNAVSALESLYRNGQKQCWHERYTTDMAYASGVLNACRAAMLQDEPVTTANKLGNSPVIPDTWILVSERLPEEGGRYWCYVEEQNDLGKSHYQWNCSWNGERWWVESEHGGIVTHWMPLPAAPQEVKSE